MSSGFVDIHSHIAYGLDDGSPNRDVSIEMLTMAAESGTTDIVATPHANSEYEYDPSALDERLEDLRAAMAGQIQIHYGCDFHLDFRNVEEAVNDPARYTINGRQYLLVELPTHTIYPNVEGIFQRLMGAGIVPIITHPERNAVLQRDTRALRGWVESGCLLQVTGQSILGGFGPKVKSVSDELLADGLVHFIASDAHDCVRRVPRLDLAYQYVAESYGAETADLLLTENPANVLQGFGVDHASPGQPPKARRWYERLLR